MGEVNRSAASAPVKCEREQNAGSRRLGYMECSWTSAHGKPSTGQRFLCSLGCSWAGRRSASVDLPARAAHGGYGKSRRLKRCSRAAVSLPKIHTCHPHQQVFRETKERKARMRHDVLMQINPTAEEKKTLQANYRETLQQQIQDKADAAALDFQKDVQLAEGYRLCDQKTQRLRNQETHHRNWNRDIQRENEELARQKENRQIMERNLEIQEMNRTENQFLSNFGTSL